MTTELRQVRLPTSGKVVTVCKPPFSSAALTIQVRRSLPKPQPPMQKVDYGNGEEWEENGLHPDYQAALRAWEGDVNLALCEALVDFGTEVHQLTGEELNEAHAARRKLERVVPLNGMTDKDVWLRFVAVASDEDYRVLWQSIAAIGTATEAQIAAYVETFRGDVQGAGRIHLPDDAERGSVQSGVGNGLERPLVANEHRRPAGAGQRRAGRTHRSRPRASAD